MSKVNKNKPETAKRSVREFGETLIRKFHERQAKEEAAPSARRALKSAPALSRTMQVFSTLKPNIVSMENLHMHLHVAMMLELATIPPYLSAIYTMQEGDSNAPNYKKEFGDNFEVQEIIRTVLVEEMLHLTLAGNVLNAVGGTARLLDPQYVPEYPTQLPMSASKFWIHLDYFSQDQIDTFIAIEFPTPAGKPKAKLNQYETIGQLYNGIIKLLEALVKTHGEDEVFIKDHSRQIAPEHYYNSGGGIIKVTDLKSAKEAIELIIEQGEGTEDTIWDIKNNKKPVRELAHYYKFVEIKEGRRYLPTQIDPTEMPMGEPLDVRWDKIFPMQRDVKTEDYPDNEAGKALAASSQHFNMGYRTLLEHLQMAFTGEQAKMRDAIMIMFKMKYAAIDLMRTPFPGKKGVNAGPSFQFLDKKGKVNT